MGRSQQTAVKSEPPPGPSDVPGWQEVVRNGSYQHCRLEDVVVAVQDLRAELDKPTLHALAKHLSDCMMKILRTKVGAHHPNKGWDIIEEVHTALWTALLKPESKDGQGLRKAFTPRLEFRVRDALRRQDTEEERREQAISEARASSDGDGKATSSAREQRERVGQDIDVEAALERIRHPQKRLAFRLHMEGMPFKSTKGPSIEKTLGVTERTAREWVKEAKEILKTYKGDVS
jgi:RNA polymerase sigma factor (sigma-70 family)